MLKVWTNDADYVIAESAEGAERITRERSPGYVGSADDWTACPDDGSFTFYGDGDRSGLGITKRFNEWADERDRGYFCTSEI